MKIITILLLVIFSISPLFSQDDSGSEKKKGDTIVIEPTITTVNKEDKKFSERPVNPYVAGVLSLMPVWSGSWNCGCMSA